MLIESFDDLGDRMKRFEMAEAGRTLMPGLPILARLDGRAFHTFTRGMQRPYDKGFIRLMQETAKHLVGEMHADLGYVQSDEITLVWLPKGEMPFGGRTQKLESVLAGMCSAFFNMHMNEHVQVRLGSTYPHFDCRVWAVPTLQHVHDVFKWRELDASKNSLTMLAQAHYSHKALQGVKGREKHELLHAKGVNWNDEPQSFKRGSFIQKKNVQRELPPEVLANIPIEHRPDGPVTRSEVKVLLDLPSVAKMDNASFNWVLRGGDLSELENWI